MKAEQEKGSGLVGYFSVVVVVVMVGWKNESMKGRKWLAYGHRDFGSTLTGGTCAVRCIPYAYSNTV